MFVRSGLFCNFASYYLMQLQSIFIISNENITNNTILN